MARAGSRDRKRAWRKVAVGLTAGMVAVGSIIFLMRYEMAVWYMERSKKTQEMVILFMLENARPLIEKEIQMNLPERILSAIAGRRNEKERQTDALKDVRKFGESGFENHRLKFTNTHRLGSLNGFSLQGHSFALAWNRGQTNEVLAAFNVNLFKRKISRMLINQNCGFFSELRIYVEKKAREK